MLGGRPGWSQAGGWSHRIQGRTERVVAMRARGCSLTLAVQGHSCRAGSREAAAPPDIHPALKGKSWQALSFCHVKAMPKMLEFAWKGLFKSGLSQQGSTKELSGENAVPVLVHGGRV